MPAGDEILLLALIFGAAVTYTSVGHAGASGYIAAMAIAGIAPAVMRPTALALNILVAGFATYRWSRAGLINWRSLLPLVATSIPCAFIGGAVDLPVTWYRVVVGLMLVLAGLRLIFEPRQLGPAGDARAAVVPVGPGAATGAIVGFLSGLTGTGGGIFLSPLLLAFGWAGARQGAGLTTPFILVNSVAGLFGNLVMVQRLPAELPELIVAAMIGAVLGTQIGIKWASTVWLQRMLGAVLIAAGAKFLWV